MATLLPPLAEAPSSDAPDGPELPPTVVQGRGGRYVVLTRTVPDTSSEVEGHLEKDLPRFSQLQQEGESYLRRSVQDQIADIRERVRADSKAAAFFNPAHQAKAARRAPVRPASGSLSPVAAPGTPTRPPAASRLQDGKEVIRPGSTGSGGGAGGRETSLDLKKSILEQAVALEEGDAAYAALRLHLHEELVASRNKASNDEPERQPQLPEGKGPHMWDGQDVERILDQTLGLLLPAAGSHTILAGTRHALGKTAANSSVAPAPPPSRLSVREETQLCAGSASSFIPPNEVENTQSTAQDIRLVETMTGWTRLRSALMIQRLFRMRHARRACLRARTAVLDRRSLAVRHDAAVAIQCMARRWLALRRVRRLAKVAKDAQKQQPPRSS
eukprot:NODE_1637_length_1347_cov_36.882897_g1357_i0.p1 GENE.NODE_1637_length_1347_cov_36.882897_g1357_i0~~NODE_1637_length_1347_cov_36.882897_g1357_i0.p1  ORF type:complete len:387 (-),score=74.74 NODE_1637_length_1347_cov_36.882897_g1357_i0:79-1239(-)